MSLPISSIMRTKVLFCEESSTLRKVSEMKVYLLLCHLFPLSQASPGALIPNLFRNLDLVVVA